MLPFKLSCQLQGHQADVRAVCCLPGVSGQADRIVTASRDNTAKLWALEEESNRKYQVEQTFLGHRKYVSSVCAIPASDEYPEGAIATGCNDHNIRIFDPKSEEPARVLEGHTGNVCSLVAGKFGTLVSGSWDCTARVWSTYQSVMELQGHGAAVWSVAIVPGCGKQLTASADTSIKIWHRGRCERTLTQHTDCVRSLAVLSADEFLSASNDGTCRRWLMSGDCVQTFHGHTAFVYSVACLPVGFASSGEDKSLRLWNDGEVAQTIVFPTQSVWAVGALCNGDVVTGSSDGVARVFTQIADRMASAEELQMFDDHVRLTEASAKSNQSRIGDLDLKDVQGPACLGMPGQPGESRLVREADGVNAYQWDDSAQQWTKIGAVENAVDNKTRGQILDGQEYDFVFTVDVQDGVPALQLGYNRGEDPWIAARRFLEKNFLGMAYLEQVANFIVENSGGAAAAAMSGGSEYADPLTGGGRYVPGSAAGGQAGGVDPFTGGGRYVPGSAGSGGGLGMSARAAGGPGVSSSNGADPYTGSGRYIPGSAAGAGLPSSVAGGSPTVAAPSGSGVSLTVTSNDLFPKTSALTFDSGNAAGLLKKLSEFNEIVPELYKLSETGMYVVDALVPKLVDGSCTSLSAEESACLKQLQQWPSAQLFPGLDAIRLAIRHCPDSLFTSSNGLSLLEFLFSLIRGAKDTNCLISLRSLSNVCSSRSGADVIQQQFDETVSIAMTAALETTGAHQVAACSLLLNCAVLARPVGDLEISASLMTNLDQVLTHEPLDDNAVFRLLVAVGTLVCGVPDLQAVASSLVMHPTIARHSTSSTAKVKDCGTLLLDLIPK